MAPEPPATNGAEPAGDWWTPMLDPITGEWASIQLLMGRILAELPAIGKDQTNEQQGFKFRGIDQVLDALNPIMAKYGVVCLPHRVVEVTNTTDRKSARGNTIYATYLTMEYRFHGPKGDYLDAVGIGEGTDSLDKATPKAMTGAYKYMLFESFSISTKEASEVDADRGHGLPETTHVDPLTPDETEIQRRFFNLPDKWKDTVSKRMYDRYNDGNPFLFEPPNLPSGHGGWRQLEVYLDNAEARVAAEQQDADAEADAVQDKPPARGATEPTPVATPAKEPPVAAEPTPAPATEPATEPEQQDDGDDGTEPDEPTWDDVTSFSKTKLGRLLKDIGAKPQAHSHKNEVDRRNYYWLAIGGEFDANEPPFADGWDCPFCQISIAYDNQEDLTQHMIDQHGDDTDQELIDENAESGTAEVDTGTDEQAEIDQAAADATDELGNPKNKEDDLPVDPATLNIVQEYMKSLSGASARAYATYRREKALPADTAKLKLTQAFELIDFLDGISAKA